MSPIVQCAMIAYSKFVRRRLLPLHTRLRDLVLVSVKAGKLTSPTSTTRCRSGRAYSRRNPWSLLAETMSSFSADLHNGRNSVKLRRHTGDRPLRTGRAGRPPFAEVNVCVRQSRTRESLGLAATPRHAADGRRHRRSETSRTVVYGHTYRRPALSMAPQGGTHAGSRLQQA